VCRAFVISSYDLTEHADSHIYTPTCTELNATHTELLTGAARHRISQNTHGFCFPRLYQAFTAHWIS